MIICGTWFFVEKKQKKNENTPESSEKRKHSWNYSNSRNKNKTILQIPSILIAKYERTNIDIDKLI